MSVESIARSLAFINCVVLVALAACYGPFRTASAIGVDATRPTGWRGWFGKLVSTST